jgi:3-hydroxyisobutyrate dehydrogenase-like beta-hydroxyacid dehydrogenase
MIRLQQKDLRLALAAAERLGVRLPATALAQQLFAAVEAEGGGGLGTQAIVTALEALATPGT